eukprot:575624-Prymnesium_polylepis.1
MGCPQRLQTRRGIAQREAAAAMATGRHARRATAATGGAADVQHCTKRRESKREAAGMSVTANAHAVLASSCGLNSPS